MGAARSCCDSNNASRDFGPHSSRPRGPCELRLGPPATGTRKQWPNAGVTWPARVYARASFPRPASADRRRACARQAETRAALTDPARRPSQPREPVPSEVLQFQPLSPARLTSSRSLRETKRGSAPGLLGARVGHADDVELLTEAASLLAHAGA